MVHPQALSTLLADGKELGDVDRLPALDRREVLLGGREECSIITWLFGGDDSSLSRPLPTTTTAAATTTPATAAATATTTGRRSLGRNGRALTVLVPVNGFPWQPSPAPRPFTPL